MTYVFDGKKAAEEKLNSLKQKVGKLAKQGVNHKLVSILIGENPASVLYLNLKKKAAEKAGVQVDIMKLDENISPDKLTNIIEDLNEDASVHGIMVQLPLPDKFSLSDKEKVIQSIIPQKDVDGMAKNGKFITPVVGAVLHALDEALEKTGKVDPNIALVGAKGFEGSRIAIELLKRGFKLTECDRNTLELGQKTLSADVIISATGEVGLISDDMVQKGVILIDVGSPKPDITEGAYRKSSFYSPSPGGVGPLSIAYLMDNLITGAQGMELHNGV